MKQFRYFLLSTKIKYKLILSVYLVFIPVWLLCTGYFYYRNYNDIVEDMTRVYQSLAVTVDENIQYLQNDIMDMCIYITINSNIRYILNTDKEYISQQPLVWGKSTPVDFITDMLSIKNHIKTVILYAENGIHPFYVSRDGSIHNTNIGQIHNTPIYRKALHAMGDIVWVRIGAEDDSLYEQTSSDKIVSSRVIFDFSKKKRLGYLAIGIDSGKYETICKNALQNQNEGIVVCNAEGEELIRYGDVDNSVMSAARDAGFFDVISVNTQNYAEFNNHYVFGSRLTSESNYICYMVPKTNWDSTILNAKLLGFAFGLALLICTLPLSALASTIITKPLQRLYRSMMKFKEGDFNQQVEVIGNDEIGEVTQCFNAMVKDIKQLIDTNYVMVIRERQSELAALQAQINPHFLYNAMDSLYWQAINSGSEELAEDIFSLSQLFRLVLSKGLSEIPVEREMELISNYLHIQKMRFQKKLTYTIDMSEEILSIKIPKLILQPFVENAIVHGLECTGEKGRIDITGRLEGDYIHFEVKDNGVGMDQEKLDEIYKEIETKEYSSQRIGRYAIKNVRERLALKYQDDFTLEIVSESRQGTKVIIIIPAAAENT